MEAQEKLAELGSQIIENPEENIGTLKVIRQIAEARDSFIQRIGLLTQLAVYRDIVPGYRIRPLTDVEKAAKVSKEVKKLRTFEEGLVTNYQAYLQQLESMLSYNTKRDALESGRADPTVATTAMQCLGELLTTLTHFNFRINIMTAVVSKINTKTPRDVGVIACNSIRKLFDDDVSGEPSCEAVKLITKMIKAKNFKVEEPVLKTFLHLKLKDELSIEDVESNNKKGASKKRKNSEPYVSKKIRKALKKDANVEQELAEAEAEYSLEHKQKLHTETLKYVFLTYFRILKHADHSPLLPAVLEGLASFAHLINVDFFGDILAVLKKITLDHYNEYVSQSSGSTSAKTAFHCIIAAFQLLTGQGAVLNIDLKDFNTSLYTQMMRLPSNPSFSEPTMLDGADDCRVGPDGAKGVVHMRDVHSRCETELALLGLDLLFCRKKQ
ncbi:Nucleolar complex protein 3, partial [Chytridiales sp. JEL 0842]